MTLALFEVSAHDIDEFGGALGSLLGRQFRVGDVLLDVVLNHFGHQSVERTTHAGDALKHVGTTVFVFERALDGFHLAADTPYPVQQLLFLARRMHVVFSPLRLTIVWPPILSIKGDVMTEKPIAGLWRNRVYRHLFAAQISALVGTGLTTIALALLAYDLAGGDAGRVLGIALACKMVAYVAIAPVVGGYAQRLPRKTLLVTLDLLRAGFVFCLPWVTAVWQIYALIFLLNACSAGFTPVFQATIPEVVTDDAQYTRALSASRLAYELENLLSPTLAMALLFLVSYNQLFILNTLAFLGSAALVVTAVLPVAAAETTSINVWQRVTAGIRRYLGNRTLRSVLTLYAGVAAAGAMIIVNTVVYVRETLGGGDVQVAQAFIASGAGSMLAALGLPRWLDRHSERGAMLAGGLLLGLALLVGGIWRPGFAGLLGLWFVLGIGLGLIQTPVGRLLTAASDSASRPGLFSAQFALSHACWLIGYPLAGVLGSAFGPRPALVVLGIIALAAWALADRLSPSE